MERKHTDKKNYLSVRIKWCALLAAGLIGAVLVEMWTVCIREMRPFTIPAAFTVLFVLLAAAVHRLVLVPYRETRKIYEQFVMGYVMEDLFKVRYPFSPESEQAILRLNEIIDRSNLIAISKKQAEYLALQNQINPHFLYNTLEGIRSEALIAGLDSIAEMTEALATYFRYTISQVNNLVTLEEELANVENYYYIQQFRFGSKLDLRIRYDCEDEEEALMCQLPKLTLQPIVENSIYHGLERKIGTGHLDIKVTVTDSHLIIMISDDGVGIEKGQVKIMNEQLRALRLEEENNGETGKKGGIAVKNVNNRIKLLFGEEYGIYIYSQPDVGTDVEITLPVVRN